MLTDQVRTGEDLEGWRSRSAGQGGFVKPGDAVIITAGLPFDVAGTTNLIKVARVAGTT